jgi:hypothetical protein
MSAGKAPSHPGDDTARRIAASFAATEREAFQWPLDRQRNDDVSASRIVEDGIATAHPELDRDAVRALRWYYDFCHKTAVTAGNFGTRVRHTRQDRHSVTA